MKRLFVVLLSLAMLISMIGCATQPAADPAQSASGSPAVPSATPQSSAAQEPHAAIKPGIYSGTARGMRGPVTVEVTLDDSSITNVNVVSQVDTKHIAEAALAVIPGKIVENQSINIDTVTGATMTSYAIINATRTALQEAGASDAFTMKVEAPAKTTGSEEAVDVVIVGGGGSGLTAAAYAKIAGVGSVLVLEKLAYTGGSTSISGGGAIVGGSRYNELAGTDFTAEEYLEYFVNAANDAENRPSDMWINEDLVYKLGSVTGNTFDTFMDNGFPLPDKFWENPSTAAVWGYWGVPGRGMISFNYDASLLYSDWLTSFAKDNGADIRVNSTVTELLVENGTVTGVKVEDLEKTYEVKAKKVILACGGMEANPELVDKYAPEMSGASPFCGPGNTGDFVSLTESLNPILSGYGSVAQAGIDALHVEYGGVSLMGLSIWVNKQGERFTDESDKYYIKSRAINAQPDHMAWGIADKNNPQVDAIEQAVADGLSFRANTLEELAELIKVPADALVASVNQYNADYEINPESARGGVIGTAPKMPVLEAPFYAQPVRPLNMFTLTGLKVNDNCQVLNQSDAVIPNLYAAGEISFCNAFFDHYVCGSCAVQIALNTGRIAGEHAANEIA